MFLFLWWQRSLLYRNQFIDLLCKSMNGFLSDRNLRHERVKASFKLSQRFLMNFKAARQIIESVFFSYPWSIFNQCLTTVSPKNIGKLEFTDAFRGYRCGTLAENRLIWGQNLFNQFVLNAPLLYPLKLSVNHKVFWCFQGVEKGCISYKWVKIKDLYCKICSAKELANFYIMVLKSWH